MITKRIQNRVAESRTALPFTMGYALIVTVAGGLFGSHQWLQFILLAFTSLLMMVLNNSNALIRIYSRMVSCSFIMLAVMSHFTFVNIRCGILQACFVAFYILLFGSYQNKNATGMIFYAFVMYGLASMVFVQVLFFLPLLWILIYTNIMVGSLRVLVASLLGLAMPYCFLVAYYVYSGDIDALVARLSPDDSFFSFFAWRELSVSHIVTIAFVTILSAVGIAHYHMSNYKDKIRTRMLFEIFTFMILAEYVFVVLFPQHIDYLLALLIVNTSPLIGHYIALTHTRWTNLSFCLMTVVTLIITIFNIWMPF